MAEIEKDYEDLLRSLNIHKVKYCVIGAYAMALYVAPRYTKDMDIFVEATPSNAEKVITALRDFGFHHPSLTAKDFSKPGRTIQIGYEPVRVDILTSIDGCVFEEVWKNRIRGSYGKEKVYFIGRADLLRNKTASNRKQDQADLEALKRSKRKRTK